MLLADGNSFHAERFTSELRRQGCHVLVASLEKGAMLHLRLRKRGPVKSLHYLLAVPQVRAIVKRFQPGIINAHYASGYGFIAALAGGGSIPIMLNLWGSDILRVPHKSVLHRFKTRFALKKATCVTADSHYLIRAAERLAPLKRTKVVPWGIERRFLSYHKQSYAIRKPVKIIVPRAHDSVYNNEFIIESLAALINKGEIAITFPDFGRLADSFRKRCRTLVASRVQFYKRLPREDFLKLMARHDIYLSASSSDSSPVSLIEATALGLVPIAADIEGVKEWLDAQTGFTFKVGDKGSLRNRIEAVLDGSDDFAEMRRRNLERVRERAIFEENVAEQIATMKALAWGDQIE